MDVGIIGVGIVGGVTAKVLGRVHEMQLYDRFKEMYCNPGNLEEIANKSEVVFVCVPTPMKVSGEMDYSAIYNSLDFLLKQAKKAGRAPKDILVTIRSTAVSGTTDKLAKKYPFPIAFNPEFLTERNAMKDMEKTDRVIIGADDKESGRKLLSVYKPVFPDAKYITVSRKEAEMIKYTSNVLLTMQIAAANEIYQICRHIGIDYEAIKNAVLHDDRLGRNINVPGPDGDLGFGGKCFPKDLNALIYLARESGYRPHLLEQAWELNLKVRKNRDWLDITGATTENNFKGKSKK